MACSAKGAFLVYILGLAFQSAPGPSFGGQSGLQATTLTSRSYKVLNRRHLGLLHGKPSPSWSMWKHVRLISVVRALKLSGRLMGVRATSQLRHSRDWSAPPPPPDRPFLGRLSLPDSAEATSLRCFACLTSVLLAGKESKSSPPQTG